MNMTVTENDKKLLSFLAAFIIAILLVVLVLKPLNDKISGQKEEIRAAKQQEMNMDKMASTATDMVTLEASTEQQMVQTLRRFYPTLQSQEAENMITILMLNHNLKIREMVISMPERESALRWYQYSANYQGLQPDTEERDLNGYGVYAVRITAIAEGAKEDLFGLIDDISGNYPAISIFSTEWSSLERRLSEENTAPVQELKEEEDAEEDADAEEEEDAEADTDAEEETEEEKPEEFPAWNTDLEIQKAESLTATFEVYMCRQ